VQRFACDGCLINWYDASTETLQVVGIKLPFRFSVMQETYIGFPFSGQDPNLDVFRNLTPECFVSEETLSEGCATRVRFNRWLMAELAIYPLIDNDRPLGTVMLFSCGRRLGDIDQQALASSLHSIANALESAPRISQARRKCNASQALSELCMTLDHYLDSLRSDAPPEQINQTLIPYFLQISGFDLGSFGVLMQDRLQILPAVTRDTAFEWQKKDYSDFYAIHPLTLEAEGTAISTSFLQSKPLYFPDVVSMQGLPMHALDKEILDLLPETRSIAYIPLITNKQAIAVLGLWSFSSSHPIEVERLDTLQALCSVAASAFSDMQ
jgi:GAF domain-containing protein